MMILSLYGYASFLSFFSSVLVTFFIAVKWHHDHGSLWKKAFNWRLSYSFRGLVHDPCGGKCGNRKLDQQLKAHIWSVSCTQSETLVWCVETSKPLMHLQQGNTFFNKAILPIFCKQFTNGTKYLDICVCGDHLIPPTKSSFCFLVMTS